jgi:hypothetical protein
MKSKSIGTCGYCLSENVPLLELHELRDYFELLVGAYEQDPAGRPLIYWLKQDWLLFTHPLMDDAHAKELLSDVLDDGEIVRTLFSPTAADPTVAVGDWTALREEMMHKNRWFLDTPIKTDRLANLLPHLVVELGAADWYRARLRSGGAAYEIHQMGAPPPRLASNGRANPAGIPYLYLGSHPETAAAEVRPHTGEQACVAVFEVPAIRAIDLRDPRKHVSPFFLADSVSISQLRADLELLQKLADELTRPVLPHGAAIDYIPSQYLCEFIKKQKYDGVVYRSSVSDGFNLALFDPSAANGKAVEHYSVDTVSVKVSRIPPP